MSFHINVRIDGDGVVSATEVGGNPPPGTYVIAGHAHSGADGDWDHNTISVSTEWASASGGAQARPVGQ